jgi:hypothetical protein
MTYKYKSVWDDYVEEEKPDPERPFLKLTTNPIKYIKEAKALAYGFAVLYNANVYVVGEYNGKYLYDLHLNYDLMPERSCYKYVFFVATPYGAKMRAIAVQRKEQQSDKRRKSVKRIHRSR